MHRRSLLAGSAAVWPLPLLAGFGAGNPRLEKLYGHFIAPCCWRENLTLHHSALADDLRASIARQVSAGLTDEQIQADLVTRYTTRILAIPEGAKGQWLTMTPVAATVVGAGLVGWVIRRLHSTAAKPATRQLGSLPTTINLPELPRTEWD